jgi:hypothetical protein
MENNDYIELRSEKVRNIIGQVPPRIIRVGVTVFFIFFLLIGVVMYLYKFTYNYKVESVLWQVNDSIIYNLYVPVFIQIKDNTMLKFNLQDNSIDAILELDSHFYSTDSILTLKRSGSYKRISGLIVGTKYQIVDTITVEAIIYGDTVNFIEWLFMN